MTTPHKPSGTSTFYQKERDRLIKEIADGIGQVLGDTNTLNRKLEESVAVGEEFEPISNLWGRFVEMMSSSGITPQAAADANAQAQMGSEGRGDELGSGNPLATSTASDEAEDTLPLGVAPGGGTVYGRD